MTENQEHFCSRHWCETNQNALEQSINKAKNEGYEKGQQEARAHYYEKVANDTRKEVADSIKEVIEQSENHGDSGYCGRCSFIVSELKKL